MRNLIFIVCVAFFAAIPQVRAEHVLVLCPASFREELQPWIEHRSSQGYTIHILEPTRETGVAVLRKKIRELAAEYPVKYLLIVGDTYSSDPNVETVPAPRVDAKVIQEFGEEDHIASDNLYADLDGDELPEMALGRFSVQNRQELRTMIRKVLRYESSHVEGTWRRRINLIAGVGGFSPVLDRAIESAARRILSRTIPEEYEMTLTQADWRSPYCPAPSRFRETLIERFNEGSLFWVYMGHGMFRRLDRFRLPGDRVEPIFEQGDVRHLHCRRGTPIALLMACYSGALDTIEPCLAEELHRGEHGPVAVLASSRTSMPYGMSVFGIALIEEVFGEERAQQEILLGDVILQAKRKAVLWKKEDETPSRERSLRDTIDSLAKLLDPTAQKLHEQRLDHVHLFHLFGDPLLRLPRPLDVELDAPSEIANATRIPIRGRVTEMRNSNAAGKLVLELAVPKERNTLVSPKRKGFSDDEQSMEEYDRLYEKANSRVLVRETLELQGGEFTLDFDFPRVPRGEYDLRAYYESGPRFGLGSRKITVR